MPHRSGSIREAASLADRLLHATTPVQVADVLLDSCTVLAVPGTCVLWSTAWPNGIEAYPSPSIDPVAVAAANVALRAFRDGGAPPDGTHVLCDQDGATAVLSVATADIPMPLGELHGAGARMAEVLAIKRLHDTVAQLAQAEKLQRALFAIADMAGSGLDMPDMLRGLHRIVGELMYAENFFIALYDDLPASLPTLAKN